MSSPDNFLGKTPAMFLDSPVSLVSCQCSQSGSLELSNILSIHLILLKLARVGLHCFLLRNLSSSPCKGPFSVAPSLSSLQDLKLNPLPHEMSLMLSLVTICFLNILLSLSLILLYHLPSLCPGSSFLSLRCFQWSNLSSDFNESLNLAYSPWDISTFMFCQYLITVGPDLYFLGNLMPNLRSIVDSSFSLSPDINFHVKTFLAAWWAHGGRNVFLSGSYSVVHREAVVLDEL